MTLFDTLLTLYSGFSVRLAHLVSLYRRIGDCDIVTHYILVLALLVLVCCLIRSLGRLFDRFIL